MQPCKCIHAHSTYWYTCFTNYIFCGFNTNYTDKKNNVENLLRSLTLYVIACARKIKSNCKGHGFNTFLISNGFVFYTVLGQLYVSLYEMYKKLFSLTFTQGIELEKYNAFLIVMSKRLYKVLSATHVCTANSPIFIELPKIRFLG